jgi:hypothetical protein
MSSTLGQHGSTSQHPSDGSCTNSQLVITSCLSKLKLYYDRQSVSQSVSRSVCDPRPISLLSFIIFIQLRVFLYGTPSLTIDRVCSFQLLLGLASAVLIGSESRRTHDYIPLSRLLRLPQPGGPGPRIYIPQEQGSPVIPPKKLHGLSPRANYTDRVTAACRRSDCQLLRIEGATWSA